MPALCTHDTASQSLEVIMDTIQLPLLAIISQTPPTFIFPFNTINSSSYPFPIRSFVEPDLWQLTLTPSQPTLIRTLSPISLSALQVGLHQTPREGVHPLLQRC
ncbi:hypothetical protein PAXRUDRAFT_16984 [Paxillus rubicundulus Ve08.2h10]|uniref:Uncharacterized protein n=1 Tax=Paxillus rubicundulus Ve08.2h10 TaxID=930991 RepID=A0A0D0DC50_9AGAM|nr:hypothetical protein PAXRUDRAFT_16984 [Paxillus rubicundulus Ve08.2h10]